MRLSPRSLNLLGLEIRTVWPISIACSVRQPLTSRVISFLSEGGRKSHVHGPDQVAEMIDVRAFAHQEGSGHAGSSGLGCIRTTISE